MLNIAKNIDKGYEVISTKGELKEIPLQKKPLFVKIHKSEPTPYVRHFSRERKQDLRFEKVARSAGEVREFVKQTLEILDFQYLEAEDQLESIASMLITRFNINRLNCRMDFIHSNKCKKFHIDKVYIRSITTLLGPGTELQLGDDPNIYQVNTGDTVLLKGSQFPGRKSNVLHRSPSITLLGISRLLFVMDY